MANFPFEVEDTPFRGVIDGVGVAIRKIPLVGELFKWGTKNSLWMVHLTTGCCSPEYAAVSGAGFDFERFGTLPYASMRQSDVVLIEGQVAEKMARVVRRTYDQMPDPKYVLAVGNCAISGGFYYDSYSMTMGVEKIVPVDVFIPGCPPRPEDWIDGFRMLQRKIEQEDRLKPNGQDEGR